MDPRNKVLLFVGSGISYDPDLPSVDQLSSRILSISPDELGPTHPFCCSKSPINNPTCALGAQQFLRWLAEFSAANGLTNPNYEDLHSLCQKIEQSNFAPRIDPTHRRLIDFIRGKLVATEFFESNGESLQECALQARIFIEYTVKQELLTPEHEPKNLEKIIEYVEILGPENLDIITLNHDTLIEDLLGGRKDWTNGFEDSQSLWYTDANGKGCPYVINFYLDKALFNDQKVRLLKPHGSCNWYQYLRNGSWLWGIPRSGFRQIILQADGTPILENPEASGILSGSFTKENSYLFWQTGTMFRHAYRILHEYDRVICSGYGWKDVGMNKMFIEWIQKSNQKQILILESSEGDNYQCIDRLTSRWTKRDLGRSIIHPEWLSSTDPREALRMIGVEPQPNCQ